MYTYLFKPFAKLWFNFGSSVIGNGLIILAVNWIVHQRFMYTLYNVLNFNDILSLKIIGLAFLCKCYDISQLYKTENTYPKCI